MTCNGGGNGWTHSLLPFVVSLTDSLQRRRCHDVRRSIQLNDLFSTVQQCPTLKQANNVPNEFEPRISTTTINYSFSE